MQPSSTIQKLFRKDILIVSFLFWLAAISLYLAYHFWGVSLIDDMYYERSLSSLNEMLEGRNSHSLEFYYTKANYHISILILLFLSVPFAYALVVVLYRTDNDALRVIAPVFSIDVVLSIAYVANLALNRPLGEFITRLIDLDAETNLPTWYSSVKLFLIGFFFLVVTRIFLENESK